VKKKSSLFPSDCFLAASSSVVESVADDSFPHTVPQHPGPEFRGSNPSHLEFQQKKSLPMQLIAIYCYQSCSDSPPCAGLRFADHAWQDETWQLDYA
jgi:hypothetical protein